MKNSLEDDLFFFIFLHQNSTSAHITCSLISIKGLLKFGASNTGAEINRFFDLVKGILTSLIQPTADLSSTTVSLFFLLLRSSCRTFYNTLPSSGNASVPVDLLELYKYFSFYTNWISCLSLSSTLSCDVPTTHCTLLHILDNLQTVQSPAMILFIYWKAAESFFMPQGMHLL